MGALMELVSTAPQVLGHEGLNYVSDIDRILTRSGLRVPPEPTLEEIVRGVDLGGGEPDDPLWCPLPGESDIDDVRGLRQRLWRGVFRDGGRDAREELNAAAVRFGLTPALTCDGRAAVLATHEDVAARLASRLVPAAMNLVADGLLSRISFCDDPWCRSPFFDRTRNGRRTYCSPRCAARLRKRRLRMESEASAAAGGWPPLSA